MKTKFKYVTMMAVALVMGFSSCSSDDQDSPGVDNTPKSVKIHILNPSTYGEELTAVGQTPALNDLDVFFIGGGIVRDKGTILDTEIAGGKTFANVPGSADKVVIIANAAHLASPSVASILVNSSEAALNALMFEQSKQTDPTTDVNVYGSAGITGAPGAEVAAITLAPAISRIEIAQVEKKAAAPGVIELTSFKLAGIYINNTYTECGTDYITLPAAPASILGFAPAATAWTDGSYPARFKDEWAAPVAGTSFTPAVALQKWSYYVMPVKDEPAGSGTTSGTTIGGVLQASVPHIILKITDAQAVGYTLPSPAYVTIKDLQVGGLTQKQLERGKVYSIATIAIGGENLAATPETPAKQDVSVTATLTPWVDQPVTPVIP